MGTFRKLLLPALVTAAVAVPQHSEAATIAFTHVVGGTNTYYTLTVEENCTVNCDVQLEIEYSNPSAFTGAYLDSVQFKVDGVTPSNPDLISTTAGSDTDWAVSLANLNANGCGGGSDTSVCSEWISGGTGGGFAVVAGASYVWNFEVDWSAPLVFGPGGNLTTGNIRAAYNDSGGNNFAIFSPGGTTFNGGGGGGGGGGVVVPEPASLLLFGLVAAAGARRFRRRS